MDARLVELVEVLRQNGLRLAVSETQDAIASTALLGVDDKELLRATLKATLCKRAQDVATFDRVFDFYFGGASRLLAQLEKSLVARIREEGLLKGDELTMIVFQLERLAGQLSPFTQAALQGDRAAMARLFRGASLQIDFSRLQNALQVGFYSRRLLSGAGADRARTELDEIAQELRARGVSTEGVEFVSTHLRKALDVVESAARAEVQREVDARLKPARGGLEDRQLARLSREEVRLVQAAVRRLAEKLKARLVRRQRSRRRGQLNPRRTLRRNLTAGGVPVVPVFRTRRPQRPDVIVLCDVSDSVRTTSKLMLLFMYSLQALFTRVRSFIFVSELGEVTQHFKDAKPEDAVDVATQSDVISLASNSNYGHALATFAKGYLGAVSRRTTVLVIGDGRNNHNPAQVWALEELRRKAKRVVWLCTEPRVNWGFGDSEMLRYEKAVTSVSVVQTLGDLERLAATLIPHG